MIGPAAPLYAEVQTAEVLSSFINYADLATVGPTVVLPRPGDYIFDVGGACTRQPANYLGAPQMAYAGGPVSAADADAAGIVYIGGTGGNQNGAASSGPRRREKTGLTASSMVAKYVLRNGNDNTTIANRWLTATPLRIT